MRHRASTLLFAVVLLCAWSAAAEADALVSATVVTVTDQRARTVGDERSGQMLLEVLLVGQSLEGATTYENVRIERAVDDAGTDLSPQGFSLELNQKLQMVGERPQKKGEPPNVLIEVLLGRSVRSAARIKQIKGLVDVHVGAKRKKISVPNLPALIGGPISDAHVAAAGLKVTVAAPDKKNIWFQIEGNIGVIDSVDAIDADGKVLAHRRPNVAFFGKKTESGLALPRPLDAKMSLQFTLAPDQKSITVPFELKDVPLP